jgi:hypothetical protein
MNNFIELVVWGRRSRLFQWPKHHKLTINEDTWKRLKDDLYWHLPPEEAKLALKIVRHHEQFIRVK